MALNKRYSNGYWQCKNLKLATFTRLTFKGMGDERAYLAGVNLKPRASTISLTLKPITSRRFSHFSASMGYLGLMEAYFLSESSRSSVTKTMSRGRLK